MPERIQKKAAPAACSVRSRSQPKSFLFLLEEKNRRAQIKKCGENFLAGWRALASGGGAASAFGVVFPLKKGSRKVYNYSIIKRTIWRSHVVLFFIILKERSRKPDRVLMVLNKKTMDRPPFFYLIDPNSFIFYYSPPPVREPEVISP